jgi:hypothetical protein
MLSDPSPRARVLAHFDANHSPSLPKAFWCEPSSPLREPDSAAHSPCCSDFPHRERFFFRGLETLSALADLHAGFFARKSALGRAALLRFRDPRSSFRRERSSVCPSCRPKTRHRLASSSRLALLRFGRRRSAGDNAGVNCAAASCECLSLAVVPGACRGSATWAASARNVR